MGSPWSSTRTCVMWTRQWLPVTIREKRSALADVCCGSPPTCQRVNCSSPGLLQQSSRKSRLSPQPSSQDHMTKSVNVLVRIFANFSYVPVEREIGVECNPETLEVVREGDWCFCDWKIYIYIYKFCRNLTLCAVLNVAASDFFRIERKRIVQQLIIDSSRAVSYSTWTFFFFVGKCLFLSVIGSDSSVPRPLFPDIC